jgi:hypothetical protein
MLICCYAEFWFAATCKRLGKYCLRALFIPFVSFIIVTRKNLPISVVHDETQMCAYSGRILISEISFVIGPWVAETGGDTAILWGPMQSESTSRLQRDLRWWSIVDGSSWALACKDAPCVRSSDDGCWMVESLNMQRHFDYQAMGMKQCFGVNEDAYVSARPVYNARQLSCRI